MLLVFPVSFFFSVIHKAGMLETTGNSFSSIKTSGHRKDLCEGKMGEYLMAFQVVQGKYCKSFWSHLFTSESRPDISLLLETQRSESQHEAKVGLSTSRKQELFK